MFLTHEELIPLTGRKLRNAQAMFLEGMGIEHRVRSDGSVAVLRAYIEERRSAGRENNTMIPIMDRNSDGAGCDDDADTEQATNRRLRFFRF